MSASNPRLLEFDKQIAHLLQGRSRNAAKLPAAVNGKLPLSIKDIDPAELRTALELTSESPATVLDMPINAAKLSKAKEAKLSNSVEDASPSVTSDASKASRRPAKSLVAELAPDKGYPATDIFDNITDDGSRRSSRARKPTAKAYDSETSIDPLKKPFIVAKPARKKRLDKRTSPNNGRITKPKPSVAAARKTGKAAKLLASIPEDDEVPSRTASPTSSTITSHTSLDVLAAVALATPAHICSKHKLICASCASLTVASNRLLQSSNGKSTWYIGPVGLFEIGALRWPRAQKTVTYILGNGYTNTSEAISRASTPGSGTDTDLDTEMVEERREREVEEKGLLEDQIAEWKEFCRFGRRRAWGAWLDPWNRPDHIGEEKWDGWHQKYWGAIDAKYEAERAANPVKSWLEVV